MNRTFIIVISFLCSFTVSIANTTDSISTHYKDGEFITYSQVWVNAPKEVMNGVVDDFLYQTKYNLDALFGWALRGMKLRKEKDELIVFNFKSTQYDDKNAVVKAIGNVEVPNVIAFPEIHVNSKWEKSILPDGRTKVNIDVLYSDAFLKKTTAVFQLIPDNSKECWITLETKVRFGWYFNFFMTKTTFRDTMEWRFHKMMQNLKFEVERRTKK